VGPDLTVLSQIISRQRIPTVFKLYWSRSNPHQPREVSVGGSFNQWCLVPMNGTQGSVGHWCIIIDLPEGVHEYKFKVDDQWVHNPKERTVDDGLGGKNNVITVLKSDFEVYL
jgi:5'-AMP-activated protein kinase regulatory beta subunit